MEEEIEDIIGDVKYTDSQKSITTTLRTTSYSPDFTDSSPERNNSSDKETYVIEWDSEDSERMFPLRDSKSVINLSDKANSQNTHITSKVYTLSNASVKSKSGCSSTQSTTAQESFTQTSKTIIELAQNDGILTKPVQIQNNTLETQTSFISITEKTVEYRMEISNSNSKKGELLESSYAPMNYMSKDMCGGTGDIIPDNGLFNIICNRFTESVDDGSSKFPISETENENDVLSEVSSTGDVIRMICDESRENMLSDNHSDGTRKDESDSPSLSDMEEDSLMISSNAESSNKDVQELRDKLNESVDLCIERYADPESRHFGTLTPLTEESHRRDSLMDITPFDITNDINEHDDILITNNNNTGMKIKSLKEEFKLPPIQNQSCPNSPLDSLFCNKLNKLCKVSTLPCLYERTKEGGHDRWEMDSKNLAAGESTMISGKNGSPRRTILPPIQVEGSTISCRSESQSPQTASTNRSPPVPAIKAICIKDKIKELKMNTDKKSWSHATKYNSVPRADSRSRSASPSNVSTLDDQHRLCEVAEKGCEALCQEMMKRLRSTSWYEIIETLDEIPRVMEKFWGVITEQRIADLLRMVNNLIESPRPQVARAACSAVALIIKNTNYVKKPDFYETISGLLSKTGSYSRPLRRAANVALDDIVCSLDHSPCVCALAPKVGHKSPLVRCAAARLLVVCCALAGGGRNLLKTRPPTAANARRCALRALAALLDDKCTDTRKYAERLYSMLRPLQNFEAYYLTDVAVETATRQMKKYDHMLISAPEPATQDR